MTISYSFEERDKIKKYLNSMGYTRIFFLDFFEIRAYKSHLDKTDYFSRDDEFITFILL